LSGEFAILNGFPRMSGFRAGIVKEVPPWGEIIDFSHKARKKRFFRCDQTPHILQIPQFPKDVLVHFFYLRRSASSSIITKWLYFRSNHQMHQNAKNPEELLREYRQRG
jgi:hypothetical protein